MKIQPQIKNKKFPCSQPNPDYPNTMTKENIEMKIIKKLI